MRAIRTLACVTDPERSFLAAGSKSQWPQTLVEWADLVAQAENQEIGAAVTPFRPTPEDIGDYLVALEWVAALRRMPRVAGRTVRKGRRDRMTPDQEIVWLVAWEFSFEEIGRRIGRNALHTRRRYRSIVDDLWRIANGYVRLVDIDA